MSKYAAVSLEKHSLLGQTLLDLWAKHVTKREACERKANNAKVRYDSRLAEYKENAAMRGLPKLSQG
jgi:hypothetical protein